MQMVLLTAIGVGGATLIGSIIGFFFKEICILLTLAEYCAMFFMQK
jgi:hypothetical protein